MRKAEWIVLLMYFVPAAALAGPATPPPMSTHVTVTNAWFRSLPANLPAGGYFDVRNDGKITAHLTGVESPACGMLMLHQSKETGGVSSMGDVQTVDIAPGATVKFATGGYHLMCMSPSVAMKPGHKVPVTLKFSDGSVVSIGFDVKNARGR